MPKSIVIAEDDPDLLDLLTRRCQAFGLQVEPATNGSDALELIEKCLPDAVLLDVNMPQVNGLSVCETLANHDTLRTTPVIIMTASPNDRVVQQCHRLCAYYVPKCSEIWQRIEPILSELWETNEVKSDLQTDEPQSTAPAACEGVFDTVFAILGMDEQSGLESTDDLSTSPNPAAPWVLSIEDDEDFAHAMQFRLEGIGLKVVRAAAGTEGYRRAFLDAPRAILLDYELPQGNGDYVLRRLKESPATCHIPVVVLTGRRELSIERQMRSLGAAEFLTKPVDWKVLCSTLESQLAKALPS